MLTTERIAEIRAAWERAKVSPLCRSLELEAAAHAWIGELLDEVERIHAIERMAALQPDDVVVIRAAARLTDLNVAYIKESAKRTFPDHRVIVIPVGWEIEAVPGSEVPSFSR